MSEKVLNKIDHETRELILYSLSEDTLLLELFTILGTKNTLKFITFFGGTKIDVPTKKSIQDIIQRVLMHKLKKNGRTVTYIANMFKTTIAFVKTRLAYGDHLVERFKYEKGSNKEVNPLSVDELEEFILSLEGENTYEMDLDEEK